MGFIKAPDQAKAEYLHSLCGGGQSSTHHGAYAKVELEAQNVKIVTCKLCGYKERHTTPYKNGIPQSVLIEQI